MEFSLLLNHFKPEHLFKIEKGNFPLILALGTLLGLALDYPDYLNYDHGVPNANVTLFFGSLIGFGSKKVLVFCFIFSLVLFIGSFFNTVLQRGFSITSLILYIFSMSLHYENQTGFDHSLILPSQFFILLSLFNFFYRPSYSSPKRIKFPHWLITLPSVFLAIHYFGSGITKVIESGLTWGDGVSLITWVSLWSNPQSFLGAIISHNFWVSLIVQNLILLVEIFALFFALKTPRLNLILAAILMGFHLFNEILFSYGFWVNIFFLWLMFIKPFIDKRKEVSPL